MGTRCREASLYFLNTDHGGRNRHGVITQMCVGWKTDPTNDGWKSGVRAVREPPLSVFEGSRVV